MRRRKRKKGRRMKHGSREGQATENRKEITCFTDLINLSGTPVTDRTDHRTFGKASMSILK